MKMCSQDARFRFPLVGMLPTRALLVLGRVSNLSTVWANCTCAWLLGYGNSPVVFVSLLFGTSLMYVGGMYLNDYCDAEFDARNRPERPIPSGQVTRDQVRLISIGLLGGGFLLVAWTGFATALYGAVLVGLIVAYNLVHKKTAWGVPIMAACRAMLYLVVGSATAYGVDGDTKWAAALMFLYVYGITTLARNESTSEAIPVSGVITLAAPFVILPVIGFSNDGFLGSLLGVAVGLGWALFSFWRANSGDRVIVGKTIGPLLAGICLVDWAILFSMRFFSLEIALAFLAFFVIALVAQRRIPAS